MNFKDFCKYRGVCQGIKTYIPQYKYQLNNLNFFYGSRDDLCAVFEDTIGYVHYPHITIQDIVERLTK